MEVYKQVPQPSIKCFHTIVNGKAIKDRDLSKALYQEFSASSSDISGKNLQSYSFDRSIEDFGGSFTFTVKEDITKESLFMDKVQCLDVVKIMENGNENDIDFFGVVTSVSIGSTASNLNKVVTVSGKSIEWLFTFFNINNDIKTVIFSNDAANKIFKTDLEKNRGEKPISIKDIVKSSYDMFKEIVNTTKMKDVSNFIIGNIIDYFYGTDTASFINAPKEAFNFPISSNLFTSGKINVIDFIRRLLPQPIYEIYGSIEGDGLKLKLNVREAPYSNPSTKFKINPNLLTDFTLTRSCEEVYTAFMPYIEGSSQSSDFYMDVTTAKALAKKEYNVIPNNPDKVSIYGLQLLTCSFVGYAADAAEKERLSNIQSLGDKMKDWFSNLDDMYSGDITMVNLTSEKKAKIGDWVEFAQGLFYVIRENHTWNYGDNPMINYSVIRGGRYIDGKFKKLEKLSAVYREFD